MTKIFDFIKKIKNIIFILFIYFIFQEIIKVIFHLGIFRFSMEQYMQKYFMLSCISFLFAIPIILYNIKGRVEKEPISKKNVQKSIYYYFLIFLLVNLILYFYYFLSRYIPFVKASYDAFSNFIGKGIYQQDAKLYAFLYVCLIAPIGEELVFRGIIYQDLKKFLDEKKVVIITALLFGIAHFNLVQSSYAFVLGLYFAYVMYKYKNIKLCILLHFINNIQGLVNNLNVIYLTISILVLIHFIYSKKYKNICKCT